MTSTALIVGGAGQIGRAMAANLLAHGWRVRIAGRSAAIPTALLDAGVESVRVDREDPVALARAVGEGADAVIDCIAFTAEHGRQLLALQEAVGAFVVVSSASVYVDARGRSLDEAGETGFPDFDGPLAETHPTVAPGPQTYSTRKIALERTLLDESRVPVTVLRPCAIHGPGSTHAREWWFLKRALDDRRRVPLAYDGHSRFHTTATANLAELCRLALEQPAGRVLNVGDTEPPTVRQIGEAIGAAVGHAWDLVGLAGRPQGTVGATPWSIPRPILVSMAAAERLGYRAVTSYADAMPALCDALRETVQDAPWQDAFPALAAYPFPLFDYAAEDDWLASAATLGSGG